MANIPDSLLNAVAQVESSGNPNAVNKDTGALGMFQFMPATAKALGIDPLDPVQAKEGARQYLGYLVDKFGTIPKALAAWNWGEGNLAKHGLDAAPPETQAFIPKVLNALGKFSPISSAQADEMPTVPKGFTAVSGNPFADSKPSQDAPKGFTAVDGNPFEAKSAGQPEDGTVSRNPDGTLNINIVSEPKQVAQNQTAQPVNSAQQLPQNDNPYAKMGAIERGMKGFDLGVQEFDAGLAQLGINALNKLGLVSDNTVKNTQQYVDNQRKDINQLEAAGTAGKIGRIVGNVAPTLLIPGAAPETLAGRIGVGALESAATAGVMPTVGNESRLQNMKNAAVAGGATAGVLGSAGKAIGAIRGKGAAETSRELSTLSSQHNVPLTVGELRNNQGLKKAETLLENVPVVGTTRFREKQANALNVAANNLADSFKPHSIANGTVDDVNEVMHQSILNQLAKNKVEAGTLYDKVGQLAQGKGPVETDAVKQAADSFIQREMKLPESVRNNALIANLESYKNLNGMDFETARILRSRIGDEVRRMRAGNINGTVRGEDVAAMQAIKGGLEQDMENYAKKQGGDIYDAWKAADQTYRDKVVPFKVDPTLRKVQKEGFDTDTVAKLFIKADRPKLANQFFKSMDSEGQQAAKYAVIKSALDAATDPVNKTPFSPLKFANTIDHLGKTNNVIFTPAEKMQLDGFVKLARAAERAGQYAENPATGNRMVQMAIGGGGAAALLNPATSAGAVKAGALSYGITKLLTTDAGRRLLTVASKTKPQSKAMQMLVEKAQQLVVRGAGVQASKR